MSLLATRQTSLIRRNSDEPISNVEGWLGLPPNSEEARRQLRDPLLPTNDGARPTDVHELDGILNSLVVQAGETSNPNNEGGEEAPTFWGLFFFRALYFLNGLSASTWGRFGIIYYNQEARLKPEQIGVLQGIAPLISFVMMPFWGVIADYCLQSRKQVYLFCKLMGTLCLMMLFFLRDENINFRIILICISGMSLFRASGILDAFVLEYLGQSHKGLYGTIRLWTAISWGLGAVIMGWITDAFGFNANFLLFGSMMSTMVIVVGFGLPARSKQEQARYDSNAPTGSNEGSQNPRVAVLVRSLCRIPVVFWLFQVVVIGAAMALVDSFLFVYLVNDLSASTRLCGLTVGVTVLFELPIFHFSHFLLQTVGHDALFAISMAAFVIRAFGYTLLTESTVSWVLALEVLHGITFACMWISSIDFSATVAPEEWSTTVQSILSASLGCFGNVLGSLLGGFVMQEYSAVVMYRGMGCIVCGTLLVHLLAWLGCGKGHHAFLQSLDQAVDESGLDEEINNAEERRAESVIDVNEGDQTTVAEGEGDGKSVAEQVQPIE